jgi:DNA-binding transcriptional ArsR family regulator
MTPARAKSMPPRRSAGGDADLATIGVLVADQARCRMLFALADGGSLSAGRLATEAEVSPATASSHLGKLTEAGLLVVESKGRFRNYRLAGPDVANLIEALERLAPRVPVRSLRQSERTEAWIEARTCYDHLAGRLGVALMAAMLERGHLAIVGDNTKNDGDVLTYAVADDGARVLAKLGIALPTARWSVRFHDDSTEAGPHLSGVLGRAIFARFLEAGWVSRAPKGRVIHVTDQGKLGLATHFDIHI